MKSSVLLWRAWACAAVASAKEHCKETLTSSSTGGAVLKAAQMADSSPTNPRHPGKCLSDETKHEKGGNFMPYIRVRAWRSHLVASLGVALAFLGWLDHPAIATTMLTTGKTMADGAINLTLTVDKNTSLPLGALKLPRVQQPRTRPPRPDPSSPP